MSKVPSLFAKLGGRLPGKGAGRRGRFQILWNWSLKNQLRSNSGGVRTSRVVEQYLHVFYLGVLVFAFTAEGQRNTCIAGVWEQQNYERPLQVQWFILIVVNVSKSLHKEKEWESAPPPPPPPARPPLALPLQGPKNNWSRSIDNFS